VLLSVMFLLLTSFSSTLLILLLLLSVIYVSGYLFNNRLNLKNTTIILVIVLFLVLKPTIFPESQTMLRINDIIVLNSGSNLSSLVYANGWYLILENLVRTSGFGLGLNAMGCSPLPFTPITEWLNAIGHAESNLNDGSFLFSKIGSEFGLIGIAAFLFATLYCVRGHFYLSLHHRPNEIIAYSWLIVITVGGFIRSTGYFSGPVILGILAFFILVKYKGRKIKFITGR